jgi:hypothetical protein
LGRRKRRGGSPFGGGGVAQSSVDGNAIAPAASSLLQQDPLAAGTTSMAAGQAAVSNLINNAVPWVLVPIIDNSCKYIITNSNDEKKTNLSCVTKYNFPIIPFNFYIFVSV